MATIYVEHEPVGNAVLCNVGLYLQNIRLRMKDKRIRWALGIWVVLTLVSFLWLTGRDLLPERPPPQDYGDFHLIDYFKVGGLKVIAYAIETPTQRDINAFCKMLQSQHRHNKRQTLKIYFFDDPHYSPRIHEKYTDLNPDQNRHVIATYIYEGLTQEAELIFHHDLPVDAPTFISPQPDSNRGTAGQK
ncbi:MAG: hypothetical protein D6675_14490 [Gemmatimonadetes bacterium]|nr:MAG: hypothetical protein D6675_14490 [Gemmatimonadota bacterium]